jgi:antitoxin component YwqK of YwqJK toxin-antitoxin module
VANFCQHTKPYGRESILIYFRHMKHRGFLFVCLLCLSNVSISQKIEKFYDYQWEECAPNAARFYSVVIKKDSGWVREDYYLHNKKLQMVGKYKDMNCKVQDGYFYYFYPDGVMQMKGQYVNNKKEGLWVSLHPNGFMSDSTVYDANEKVGISLQWHNNGVLSDSTNYKEDGTAVAVSWFDNGQISSAGRLNLVNQYNGKWQFYHKNGKLSATEIYNNGKLVDYQYFSENGAEQTDTTGSRKAATYRGGTDAWMSYLRKNLYFPSGYKIENDDKAILIVEFTVDDEGNVKNPRLDAPLHPVFDDIVLKVFKRSPKWIPAMEHNRRVVYMHRQSVTFAAPR